MHTYVVPFIVLTASAGTAFGAGPVDSSSAGDSTIESLRTMVSDLQKQVDVLKSQTDQNWLTEQRAAQIKGLVQDVLADADTRASLLQGGAMAGWDKGFYLSSADGNYMLKVGGQLQIRYVYNIQDDNGTNDSNRSGFEVRRAKLKFAGHVFDPSWQYEILIANDRGGSGSMSLDDNGWIMKDFGNGWKVKAGQMKAPFLREEILSSTKLFAVERSLVNSYFTAGTVQGVEGIYEADQFRVMGMFSDGNNSKNTAWSNEDTEYAFTARLDWKPMGEWKTLEDYQSFKDEGKGIIVGAAVNYSKAEYGTGNNLPAPDFNNAEVENFGATLDATFDLEGFGISAAFFYRHQDTDSTGLDLDQYGILVRGGYFVTDDVELYAQYEWADPDSDTIDDLSVFTFGVNKYWAKHNIKWQNDFGYGINSVSSTFAQDSAGWRADAPDQDGQIVLRTQIQLLF